MSGRLSKFCPACGHANDPAEIYCQGLRDNGDSCQYNLLDVEAFATAPAPAAAPVPAPATTSPPAAEGPAGTEIPINGPAVLSCRNGHALAPTDQLCLICGAEPEQDTNPESAAGHSPPIQAIGDRLNGLPLAERQNPELLRSVVAQVDALLFNLQRQGRCAPDLSLEQLLIVSRDPLRIALAPGSEQDDASTGGDLSINPSLEWGRYAAPERLVGIQAPSSDWWSLGLMVLELLVGPDFWQDVHPQAWQLQVITDGVAIPESITEPWRTLLRGLLTRDPQSRWSHSEISRWLDGDDDIPLLEDEQQGESRAS
jgi:hypothetical protein